MCLKMLITVPFERSEPFRLIMGMLVPSLCIESIDSMVIYVTHIPTSVKKLQKGVMHVIIDAIIFCLILNAAPCFYGFGTSIPTSFNSFSEILYTYL